ncbi:MAG: DUF3048 domain-containing protein [Actinomycetota bacterium]|nr:DUF3048 domain-containing protein [Actinomycetota bacterium]
MSRLHSRGGGRLGAAVAGLTCAALLAACGSHHSAHTSAGSTPASTAATTPGTPATTTVHHRAVCPLTGLPAPGGVVPHRAALAIKVGNDPGAWPQSGLDRADVVIEEPIEGAMTRLIAVFQCQQAAPVGPVRSTRWTDDQILPQFGRAGFAYAGGVTVEEQLVAASPLVNLNFNVVPGAFYRSSSRYAPENLYTSTAALWADMGSSRTPPKPIFRYGALVPGSRAVSRVTVQFSSFFGVQWQWNPIRRQWIRWVNGSIDRTAGGVPEKAANVVIEDVHTFPGVVEDTNGAQGVNSITVGSGPLTVLTRGRAITGTWSRSSNLQPARLTAADGRTIRLAPGVTWIELLSVSGMVTGSLSLSAGA